MEKWWIFHRHNTVAKGGENDCDRNIDTHTHTPGEQGKNLTISHRSGRSPFPFYFAVAWNSVQLSISLTLLFSFSVSTSVMQKCFRVASRIATENGWRNLELHSKFLYCPSERNFCQGDFPAQIHARISRQILLHRRVGEFSFVFHIFLLHVPVFLTRTQPWLQLFIFLRLTRFLLEKSSAGGGGEGDDSTCIPHNIKIREPSVSFAPAKVVNLNLTQYKFSIPMHQSKHKKFVKSSSKCLSLSVSRNLHRDVVQFRFFSFCDLKSPTRTRDKL